jgi:F0F1-type ATP synthase delta subunit
LPSLRAELLKLYDDNHHRGCLRIASSRPLESDQEKAIIARFQKHFPEKSFYVEYHMLNEPGITAQFKDYLLDLRVTHRLHRIKNKILQG